MSSIFPRREGRGAALFYAVLVTSVALVITMGILNVSYRQLALTAVGQASQQARSVALAVYNCVRDVNLQHHGNDGDPMDDDADNPFGQLKLTDGTVNATPSAAFDCTITINDSISMWSVVKAPLVLSGPARVTSTYLVSLNNPNLPNRCAEVTVTKYAENDSDPSEEEAGKVRYRILGYNVDSPCTGSFVPRLIEREISFLRSE